MIWIGEELKTYQSREFVKAAKITKIEHVGNKVHLHHDGGILVVELGWTHPWNIMIGDYIVRHSSGMTVCYSAESFEKKFVHKGDER